MRSTWPAVAVGALVLGVFAVYAWSAGFWIDPIDEGYFLDMADRILRGELPYRDFATYYTPGIFYLFALCLKLFGISILPVRYLMAGVHAVCALLLYGLTKRVAPWQLALLPFAVVAALDHWPIDPEPHPSWPAIMFCLLTMEMVSRHVCSGRVRWLALAGLSTGLTFLFKQNIGAFTAIALAGYIVLRPRTAAGALLRATQVLFAAGVGFAITAFLWPDLDPTLAVALWLPPLVTLAFLTRRALGTPSDGHLGAGLAELISEGGFAIGTFGAVTASWLLPLVRALAPGQPPFALFLGSVERAGIALPFEPFTVGVPPLAFVAIWLPTTLVVIDGNNARVARCILLGGAIALTWLIPALPTFEHARPRLTNDPGILPWLTLLDESLGNLHLYLPALAAWAAIATLLILHRERNADGPAPWYLLFGVLAGLTLYPRIDSAHVIISSPPILVAGAWALGRVHSSVRASGLWRSRSVVLSLLILPVGALVPQLALRYADFVAPDDVGAPQGYASLGLPRAAVLVPPRLGADTRGVVTYVQAGTPPGEPLFTYPAAPLLNFLADRPNPTRFDHLLPGTLTDQDLAEVIGNLRQARPRYVIWDHAGVLVFQTDPANRALSDYLWTCYHEVTAFHLYLVLERSTDAC